MPVWARVCARLWGYPMEDGQPNLGGKCPIRKLTLSSIAGAVNSSSARGGAYEPHPFKCSHLVGLILYRSCAHNHGCCEFSSVTALLCPEDPVSQPSSLSSDSCNLPASCTAKFPEPREEREGGSLGHRSIYGWALHTRLFSCVDQWWISALTTLHCQRMLLW